MTARALGSAGAAGGAIDLIPDEHVAALLVPTPPGWGDVAVSDLPARMSDHAHAEKKAALNALSLLSREPHRTDLARRMTRLAQEELSHLDPAPRAPHPLR